VGPRKRNEQGAKKRKGRERKRNQSATAKPRQGDERADKEGEEKGERKERGQTTADPQQCKLWWLQWVRRGKGKKRQTLTREQQQRKSMNETTNDSNERNEMSSKKYAASALLPWSLPAVWRFPVDLPHQVIKDFVDMDLRLG